MPKRSVASGKATSRWSRDIPVSIRSSTFSGMLNESASRGGHHDACGSPRRGCSTHRIETRVQDPGKRGFFLFFPLARALRAPVVLESLQGGLCPQAHGLAQSASIRELYLSHTRSTMRPGGRPYPRHGCTGTRPGRRASVPARAAFRTGQLGDWSESSSSRAPARQSIEVFTPGLEVGRVLVEPGAQ